MGGVKKKADKKKAPQAPAGGEPAQSAAQQQEPSSSSSGDLGHQEGEERPAYTVAKVPGREPGAELIECNVSLPGVSCALPFLRPSSRPIELI